MRRIALPISVALLAALGLLVAARAHATVRETTLEAKVGPGFSITLTDSSGASVTHLDPGPYTIEVDDESAIHNFHLAGPGVDQSTSIDGTGKTVWNVTLANGTYTFICDAHPQTMKGQFTVGSGSPPTTTTTSNPRPPAAKATALVGTVGPGETITLKRTSGAKVRSLRAGKYRITVHDRAAIHDFHLTGPHVNKKTGIGFVGTVTWTLTLGPGAYSFKCDSHPSVMHGSFRVTAAS